MLKARNGENWEIIFATMTGKKDWKIARKTCNGAEMQLSFAFLQQHKKLFKTYLNHDDDVIILIRVNQGFATLTLRWLAGFIPIGILNSAPQRCNNEDAEKRLRTLKWNEEKWPKTTIAKLNWALNLPLRPMYSRL